MSDTNGQVAKPPPHPIGEETEAIPREGERVDPSKKYLRRTLGRTRIVIIGGGFSGAYCARAIEKAVAKGKDPIEVLLIDRHNYFVFYPLLIEAGTGMLAPTHTVVSIRSFMRKGGDGKFLMGELMGADFTRNCISVMLPDGVERDVEYDHLVLAMGSVTKFPDVPGLKEHAYEIKNLAQAVALRDRAVQLLEQADATDDVPLKKRLLHFVVVGGSYTGVEVAGEYHAYLREAAKKYPGLEEEYVRLTLIDTNDRILSTLPPDLSKWAGDHLAERGIDMKLKDSVSEVREDGVIMRSNGEFIPCSTVIWAAGIAPPEVLGKLGLPTEKGWLLCETDGRVKGMQNVWGIGDAAVNPGPDGKGYPATAQHALQEGTEAGKNIVRTVRKEKTVPIVAKNRGTLAPLGRFDAVAVVYGIRLKGFLAWFLWRGFYVTKVPGWGRAMHVITDWVAAMVFGRDFVEMGLHRIVRAAQHAAREKQDAPHDNPQHLLDPHHRALEPIKH